jgi:predicted polyphosphate/ATP-dependent NAD kinase
MLRIGLIVNPIAGLGGRVGLKGSDGIDVQRRALELGAIPHSMERATEALKYLLPLRSILDILTYPGEMGDTAVRQAGFSPHVLGKISSTHTTAEDTKRAVKEFLNQDLSLLLFAGGDGTARDIYTICGTEIPTLGIPAGVKIHSGVYARHAQAAGELALAYLQAKAKLILAEVMDVDEEAFRNGYVSPKLYGYLQVPSLKHYIQGAKSPSIKTDSANFRGIAEDISDRLENGSVYIFGPGSSTYEIAKYLGLEKTLLGVDVYQDRRIVALDTNESELLDILARNQIVKIVVTPIGGQGCLFGRGNQQISPDVLRKVEKQDILIVCSKEKLNALNSRPLWVDTGDSEVNQKLCGYYPIITGYKDYVMYKVSM